MAEQRVLFDGYSGDLNSSSDGLGLPSPGTFLKLTIKEPMNHYSPSLNKSQSVQTIVTKRHITEGFSVAWTDGACEPNPGFGGWGFRIESAAGIHEHCGGESETTSNRMELRAILEALDFGADVSPIIIRTDSQLCVLCATGRWKRKTNLDLWRDLDLLCRRREVVFEWWRGHCGTSGNERADELAAIGREAHMQNTSMVFA